MSWLRKLLSPLSGKRTISAFVYTDCLNCGQQKKFKFTGDFSSAPCSKCGSVNANCEIGFSKPNWWKS